MTLGTIFKRAKSFLKSIGDDLQASYSKVRVQKRLFKSMAGLRTSPGLGGSLGMITTKNLLKTNFQKSRLFAANIPRDPSSPGEVLRPEMVLNKLL